MLGIVLATYAAALDRMYGTQPALPECVVSEQVND
jgi:hypothetical protein